MAVFSGGFMRNKTLLAVVYIAQRATSAGTEKRERATRPGSNGSCRPPFVEKSMTSTLNLITPLTGIFRQYPGRFALFMVLSLSVLVGVAPTSAQEAESSPDKRLQNASLSFREVMHEPDKGIPRDLFDKSRCIVIIPGVKKGAFIVGGKYGRGFVSRRRNGTGRFGTPAAIRIEGGSYGLQIGGSSTDVFMLVMNEGGMKKLLSDKLTIGGEAEAAAGPVGRDTSANTDVLLLAEILSWSRSRGLFAGLSLEGSTLRPDESEDAKLYGEKVTNQQILQGDLNTPAGARPLVAALNRYNNGGANGDVEALGNSGRVTLSSLRFETGKADIAPGAEASLTDAVNALKEHPDWKIRVEGFTDNVGSREANLKLSTDRANAV